MAQTEVEKITSVVARVSHYIDAKKWVELRALYADEVETDYTSLFGGSPQRSPGDDLVGGWKKALSRVVTHHLLGPVDVEIDGASAHAECHVRADHFANGDEWVVFGHYVFELGRSGEHWHIQKMTLETLHQTGNTKLLEGVAR